MDAGQNIFAPSAQLTQNLPLNEIFLSTVLLKQLEKGVYAIFQIYEYE